MARRLSTTDFVIKLACFENEKKIFAFSKSPMSKIAIARIYLCSGANVLKLLSSVIYEFSLKKLECLLD
jgi:hypothetical protein